MRKQIINTWLILFLAASMAVSAVPVSSQASDFDFDKEDAIIFGANALLQGTIAGIGAVCDGRPFWKNFREGALSGLIISSGKYMVANDEDLAWPAKFVTALGTSMNYNTVQGKGLLDSFGFDFGPAYFRWKRVEAGGGYDFKPFLLPVASAGMVWSFVHSDKFSLRDTLKYGTPVFYADDVRGLHGEDYDGFYIANSVILEPDSPDVIRRHELVHTHQYTSSASLGALLLKNGSLKKAGDIFEERHLKIDTEIGYVVMIAPQQLINYDDRPIELEAYGLTD